MSELQNSWLILPLSYIKAPTLMHNIEEPIYEPLAPPRSPTYPATLPLNRQTRNKMAGAPSQMAQTRRHKQLHSPRTPQPPGEAMGA